MRPGIFAKTFAGGSLEQCLDRVGASGITAIQFNLALTGGSSLPRELPPRTIERVRDALRARGLEMVAVSGTYNMAHPDRDVRRYGLEALATIIAAAPELGTRLVTLCTGTRDPQDMWRRHPDNDSAAAWNDMLASVRAAVRVAEHHDVMLGIEPEHGNVVIDAGRARRLLDEIGSPLLKIVFDAANLILPAELDRQEQALTEAFELLGHDLVLAHAKDVRANGTVVAAGRGVVDYPLYLSLLRRSGYEGALVLHGLEPDDVAESVAFLTAQLGHQRAEAR